jgi:glycosyltransferase involved in cell wall biosynthesis
MAHAAVDLACAQASLGHDVFMCSAGGDFEELLRAHGVKIAPLRKPAGFFSRMMQVLDLFRVVRALKPDVVHAHMVFSAVITWSVTRIPRTPFVTVVQNSFSRAAVLMKLGDLVITGSAAVADTMARRGVPREKLRPVLNGTIGSARFSSSDIQPKVLAGPSVLCMCGLHPRKGVADLIAGFEQARRQIPELHLYHVGEGPCAAEYQAQVSAENRDHIHFCGPTMDPRPWLLGADAFVLASLADPAPLAIIEAREAGLAVVATHVDGIPELLENGEAGLLVPPSAPEQIAQKLVYLFSDPAHLRMWRKNSQVGIEKFAVRRVAEKTVSVYAELLGRRAYAEGRSLPSRMAAK